MQRSGFFTGWVGAITAGVSLVEATQNNTNIATSFTFMRKSPTVDWLRTHSRTVINFSNSYGKVTQPGTPDVKTSIIHADGEQDEYLTDRLYVLGHASFDHNFSQGLDLQQLYGGGLGYTAVKDKLQQLDFKVDLHYEKQQFDPPTTNANLIGSEFVETYIRKLPRGMVLTQGLLYDSAWNEMKAYSAQGNLGLAAPLSKKFSLAINLLDGFINNPPPGFKKNSLQFTTGLTYTIK
jgi:putative salt-induced outer membrane protein YdiY